MQLLVLSHRSVQFLRRRFHTYFFSEDRHHFVYKLFKCFAKKEQI